MQPFAYGLREHEIFKRPLSVDRSQIVEVAMPPYFADDLDGDTIKVLPITKDPEAKCNDGWCTYTYAIHGCPELEVVCGGINDKTPKAGAIWRQGNLLHFGFEPPPSQLNSSGQAVLVNAIAYIARFVEDRPIINIPSPFKSDTRYFGRDVIHRVISKGDGALNRLKYYTTEDTFQMLREMDLEPVQRWAERYVPYVKPGTRGKLEVDQEAVTFGVSPQSKAFLSSAIDILGRQEDRASLARVLLDRYVPNGPNAREDVEQWKRWHEENVDYLFFSDSGGYRWYIDPLAKLRDVPTDVLQGVRRASLPAFKTDPSD